MGCSLTSVQLTEVIALKSDTDSVSTKTENTFISAVISSHYYVTNLFVVVLARSRSSVSFSLTNSRHVSQHLVHSLTVQLCVMCRGADRDSVWRFRVSLHCRHRRSRRPDRSVQKVGEQISQLTSDCVIVCFTLYSLRL